ncbi:MAG: hypothetical protein E7292_06930 [Lachnospiraceae bacterium]|nr:hypothetical protein [Lachnospiraceae bacterium]
MKLFSVFGKQLFGAHFEGLKRSMAVALVVYFGLYFAEIKMNIAPVVLYLVCMTFPLGIMWQALSSHQNSRNLEAVLILPFEQREFVGSYVLAMCIYVLVNKSSIVFAIFWALGVWRPEQIMLVLLVAVMACLFSMALYTCRNRCVFWKDAYAFYYPVKVKSILQRRQMSGNMFLYIMRYLCTNKNYLINTVGLCGVAILLPLMLQQIKDMPVVPIGFGILCINTPLCILLSVDRDLQQAIKMLPGQGMRFCVKYAVFLAGVNLFVNSLFLLSWRLQCGNIGVLMMVLAVGFAVISAVLSVAMEWFFPLKNWKLESDLYHHPRKYIVPGIMILLAGMVMIIIMQ